jgi:acyl-CoA reductase-like NAD-dependent aldehyde dehydrogenase
MLEQLRYEFGERDRLFWIVRHTAERRLAANDSQGQHNRQMCSAGSRLLVDARIHDEFVERFVARTKATFTIGDPLDPATTMGPIVSRHQQQSVLSYIDIAKEEGARLALGGRTPDGFNHGAYLEPTLFTGVNDRMRIAREEVFGPVAAIMPYKTIDEATAIANDSIYGLASGDLILQRAPDGARHRRRRHMGQLLRP